MKNVFLQLVVFYLISSCLYSQEIKDNKWSIDAEFGVTNAVKPYSENHFSNTIGLFHTSVGTRFMFNNRYGVKLDAGYDRITDDQFKLWKSMESS